MRKGVLASAAVIAVVAITLVLGTGVTSARASSNTYVCGYAKSTKVGAVYLVLGVIPKSLGPAACKSFNGGFKGKAVSTNHRLGTGVVYCKYKYVSTGFKMIAAAFADNKLIGKAFCSKFHPKGWTKF